MTPHTQAILTALFLTWRAKFWDEFPEHLLTYHWLVSIGSNHSCRVVESVGRKPQHLSEGSQSKVYPTYLIWPCAQWPYLDT